MNNWSKDIKYTSLNSYQIRLESGVYIVLRNDNVPEKFTNIYVGKADSLRTRFIQHLADEEQNQCLKDNLRNSECYFRYLIIDDEQERTDKESELLRLFSWQCNQKKE